MPSYPGVAGRGRRSSSGVSDRYNTLPIVEVGAVKVELKEAMGKRCEGTAGVVT